MCSCRFYFNFYAPLWTGASQCDSGNDDINFELDKVRIEWSALCYYFMFSMFMTDWVTRTHTTHSHTWCPVCTEHGYRHTYRCVNIACRCVRCTCRRHDNIGFYRVVSIESCMCYARVQRKINKRTFCLSIFCSNKMNFAGIGHTLSISSICFYWTHDSFVWILCVFCESNVCALCVARIGPLSLIFDQNSKWKCRIY